ncbi:MAG: SCO family protein [Paucibacter sp.]|nr:SCO family protein [Roseateles sp.]
MSRCALVLGSRLALLALLAAAPAAWAAPSLKAGVFEPAAAAPEFSIEGTDGGKLNLTRFRGKLTLLVFGFTHCPEVCPTTLATLAQARKELGALGESVQVVYVTVDPERDDLERIRKYLGAFDRSFIGGTAKPEVLAALRKSYGVFALKVEGKTENYGMNHSSSIFMIDRDGRLRALMPYGHAPADFVHDLKIMLAGS